MMAVLLIVFTLVATLLLALVMWAFRRHAFSTEDSALVDLVAGIFWMAAAIALRGLWWDGVPWVIGSEAFRAIYGGGSWPNLIFHSIVIVATYRLLRGFLLMIPVEDRSHYNVLTAALYPRRIRLRLTVRKEKP